VRNDSSMYASGPLSAGHALFADRCEKCHTVAWEGLRSLTSPLHTEEATNKACLECHFGSIGFDADSWAARHQSSAGRPSSKESHLGCESCHVEHAGDRGSRLSIVSDEQCVRCHSDLARSAPATRFAAGITGFAVDHPEFRILLENVSDKAKIRLNHEVHLKAEILGPTGPVQLRCDDCHRAGDSGRPWRFGRPTLHETLGETSASEPELQQAYMAPIRYSLHCSGCHALIVDRDEPALSPDGAVPHDNPLSIRTFLGGRFDEYIRKHPEAMTDGPKPAGAPSPTLRKAPTQAETDRLSLEWVEKKLHSVETAMFGGKATCVLCHEQRAAEFPSLPPVISPPEIPRRWFEHASFSHEKHRTLDCLQCHRRAADSRETADILLPGIDLCRTCHAPGSSWGGSAGGVDDRCSLCHTYHQPPTETGQEPKMRIRDLTAADFVPP